MKPRTSIVWAIGPLALSLASRVFHGAYAATISGNVSASSVVWIAGRAAPGPVQEMRNVNKTFSPEFVVVPVGGTVRFPNDDAFFHSIYSAADADPFDIGFYETGPGKDVTFDRAGVLEVRCHIHAQMHGTIVVVDGPFQRVDGSFSFENVAAGEIAVSAWNVATGLRTVRVHVGKHDSSIRMPRDL